MELLLRAIGYQPTHAMAHYNVALSYDEQSALTLAYEHYTEFLKYGDRNRASCWQRCNDGCCFSSPRWPTRVRRDRLRSHLAVLLGALSLEGELLRFALSRQRPLPLLRSQELPPLSIALSLVQNEIAPARVMFESLKLPPCEAADYRGRCCRRESRRGRESLERISDD